MDALTANRNHVSDHTYVPYTQGPLHITISFGSGNARNETFKHYRVVLASRQSGCAPDASGTDRRHHPG